MDDAPPAQQPAPTSQLPKPEEIKIAARLMVAKAQKRKELEKTKASPFTSPTK